jgi:hypothetical protein
MTIHRVAIAVILAFCGCRHEPDAVSIPMNVDAARESFARCLFDEPPPRGDASAFEAAVRRVVRAERMTFAIRAGRCESALDGVRDRDARTGDFARAWDDLLPRIQNAAPDDITLEQSIRHTGNAWRAW